MPTAQIPDGVLSGNGWMQQQSPLTITSVSGLDTSTDGGQTGWATLGGLCSCALCVPGVVDLTLYLPAASSVPPGFGVTIILAPNGPTQVYVTPQGNDLIEGTSSFTLSDAWGHIVVISDGFANWWLVSQTPGVVGGNFTLVGGVGAYNTPPPTTQPALCVTLADVIAVLQGCGLCAAS